MLRSRTVLPSRLKLIILVCLALVASTVLGIARPAEATSGSGGSFVPVAPARIADTVDGTGFGTAGSFGAATSRSVKIIGVAGIPSTNVGAVVLDVAGDSTSDSRIYLTPNGQSRGLASLSLDGGGGATSTTVIVKPGLNGRIDVFNELGSTRVNIDVQGYFTESTTTASSGGFVPLPSKRVVRTTSGTGLSGSGKLVGGTTYTVSVGGANDIPIGAIGVYANVRVENATAAGGLRATKSSIAPSTAPILVSYDTGTAYDSGASIALGADGKMKLWTTGGSNIDVTIDVQGYFTAGDGGGSFHPLNNERVWDSRNSDLGPLKAGESRSISLAGNAGIPGGDVAGSAALTIIARDWTQPGGVGVRNTDDDDAGIGSIAFRGTYDVAVQTTAFVGLSGSTTEVTIKNYSSGTVNILLNAQGWFDPISHTDSDDPEGTMPPCLTAPRIEDRCLAASYETVDENDPLDDVDMTVAAVGQALEAGQSQLAQAYVTRRGETFNDAIQTKIESLVANGLPSDHETDPEIHPVSSTDSSISTMSIDRKELVKHKKWKGDCGCVLADVKFTLHSYMWHYEMREEREFDVIKGPAVDITDVRCNARHNRSGPDLSVHNWNRCWTAYDRKTTLQFSTDWEQHGTKGESYHNDWAGDVNPNGPLAKKGFDLRGQSWKFPSGGGEPHF